MWACKSNTFTRDKSININEFTALCTALFKNETGKPYKLDSQQIREGLKKYKKKLNESLTLLSESQKRWFILMRLS